MRTHEETEMFVPELYVEQALNKGRTQGIVITTMLWVFIAYLLG